MEASVSSIPCGHMRVAHHRFCPSVSTIMTYRLFTGIRTGHSRHYQFARMVAPSLMISCALATLATFAATAAGAPTVFNFDNAEDRLAAASGPGTLTYYDGDFVEWGPNETQFGKASAFGIPPIGGVDPDVMAFPACTKAQGYLFTHGADPNGSFGYDNGDLVSNYTLIFDIFYPTSSDGVYRAFYQTNISNSDDAEFFLLNATGGGPGISSNYRGTVTTGAWHRIAISMRAAPAEGQVQRYVDGQFVGAIGTTGSGLGLRWALGPEILLLTDDNGETAPGYLSSLYFVDRALSAPEIAALGGPSAAGAGVAGPAPAPLTPKMSRRVGAIGHRGGAFGKAPDNTLAALRLAFQDGAAGVEVDTRLTFDGIAVCFHDDTLERTTDGFGPVADITLADLKLLDAGSKYDPAFADERVPTLVEAMNEAKGKGILYLDIKTQGQADEFLRAVNETGFPVEDLWFWTPGDLQYAAEIRALIPNAKIFLGAPDAAWLTDPNYFSSLRAAGVAGFSYGSANPDIAFAAKAKSEGFIVEVFTILDPDAMRSAAAGGVDYIETDFPDAIAALQPPQTEKASSPAPAHNFNVTGTTTVLAWVPGIGATAHRVHFGTTNPPPFVAEQTSDLWATPVLAGDRTYYWRIDTVAPGGAVTGDVWSFVTPPPTLGTVMEWHFDGSLDAALGDGALAFADGEFTESQITWETTDDVIVPHIDGEPARFIRIPRFGSPADGLALTLTGMPANGGGTTINSYSFVFDMLLPGGWNWVPFFNTAPANNNDSDFFVRSDGGIGIGDLGYSPAGTIQPDTWHRIIYSADLASGVVRYYVDGVQVYQRTGGPLTNGRFSLFPGTSPGPHVRLFGDENGEMSEALYSAFAFVDSTFTASQAAALGSPKASGIFATPPPSAPPTLSIEVSNGNATLTWPAAPGRRLQKSGTLAIASWADVPGTSGQGSHTEPVQTGPPTFFRLAE